MSTSLVLGASQNPSRFSNKAVAKLLAFNHTVLPVSPKGGNIHGVKCLKSIDEISNPVDTVTLYLNPSLLEQVIAKVIALNPRRIIFNPGTESPVAIEKVKAAGIEVVVDCTLIMLDSARY